MTPAEVSAAVSRSDQVLRHAEQLFVKGSNWVAFYREILGVRGLVRRYFPTPEALAEFEQTPAYVEVQRMLGRLRARGDAMCRAEPVHTITVRLPASLHEALKSEAYQRQTTMNKLCISKLLQSIDEELVPKQ